MKKLLLIFLIIPVFLNSSAQEWKRYADSAAIYTNTNYQKALSFYLLEKQNLPIDSSESATSAFCIHKIGNMFLDLKNYDEAEKGYLLEKKIRENLLQQEHWEYAMIFNNLGILYQKKEEFKSRSILYTGIKNL